MFIGDGNDRGRNTTAAHFVIVGLNLELNIQTSDTNAWFAETVQVIDMNTPVLCLVMIADPFSQASTTPGNLIARFRLNTTRSRHKPPVLGTLFPFSV